jgi:hypothetical protein
MSSNPFLIFRAKCPFPISVHCLHLIFRPSSSNTALSIPGHPGSNSPLIVGSQIPELFLAQLWTKLMRGFCIVKVNPFPFLFIAGVLIIEISRSFPTSKSQ